MIDTKDKLMEKIEDMVWEILYKKHQKYADEEIVDIFGKKLLSLLTSEVEKERERLLKEVKECLGSDVTPVGNDFSKEGEAYTRGYNDRLSDIRKAIKQCIK